MITGNPHKDFTMKRATMTSALAVALMTASLGLSSCMDDHPDRGDRHGDMHDHDHDRDHDHHDQ